METERAVQSGMLYVSEDGALSEEQAKSITPRKTTSKSRKNAGYGAKRLIFMAVVFALAGLPSFAATDVLFLVDTTGSMGGLNNFKTVLTNLLTAIDANSLCPETIMYAVADHRNYTDGGNYSAYGVNLVEPFTSSVQDTLSAINGLTADGGDDLPESQLKAMVSIANNWLTSTGDLGFNGRTGAQKIIIWAGDAPGHIASDESGSSGAPPAGYYPSLDDTIDSLTSQLITVFALNSANYNSGLNEPYDGINHQVPPKRQQASEITAATGGKLFCDVGSGGPDIEIDIIDVLTCFSFSKDDGIDPNDCVVPDQEMVYTVCWSNDSSRTVYDAFIIDELPEGVDYSVSYTFDPNTFEMVPSDLNYYPDTHSYIWPVGTIAPSGSGCVQLTVTVNEKAVPGMYLHNVAELSGTVYDANSLNPVERRLARVVRDTNVCCYTGTVEELYVDQSAVNGGDTGLNWQNAFLDLQDALDYARSSICAQVHSIYVAQGTYAPTDTENGFVIPEDVSIYGGFPTGGCEFSERNPKRYETILTGLIDETIIAGKAVTMGDETLLDGFTVKNAFDYNIYGNGIDFNVSHCTVKECLLGYGIYVINGNAEVQWTTINSNGADGLYHEGYEHSLAVSNSWILRNGSNGLYTVGSTLDLKNSIISESSLTEIGRQGVRIENPKHQPKIVNATIANNKAEALYFQDDGNADGDPNNLDYPDLQNSILYFNNNNNCQITGFNPDLHANFCCIQDCNTIGTTNFPDTPGFAYMAFDPNGMPDPSGVPDPNNYHLAANSVCIDRANPFLDYTAQVDIDGEGLDRKYGDYVDVGADEVYDCDDDYISEADVHNDLDWDADGIVNLVEFNAFSRAWLSRSPDEYTDPNLIDPNEVVNWNPKCNLADTGSSQFVIDLEDLELFLEDWLWIACWKLEEINAMTAMMMGGGEQMQVLSAGCTESERLQTFFEPVTIPPVLTLDEQILQLQDIIASLEQIWLEEPDLQKEINAEDWQIFMDAVYLNLVDLQAGTIRLE